MGLTFPAEIWRRIFSLASEQHDLAHLWMDCRHVSKMFKDEVEHVFHINHLPKTAITFNLGSYCYGEAVEGDIVILDDVKFNLDRLGEDPDTAIFRLNHKMEEYAPEILKRVSLRIPSELNPRIDDPGHHISIWREVNDTELPGIAVDSQKCEISFNWRKAYTLFFAEEKLYNKQLRVRVSLPFPFPPGVGVDVAQLSAPDVFPDTEMQRSEEKQGDVVDKFYWLTMTIPQNESRKFARRKRLCRQGLADDPNEKSVAVDTDGETLKEIEERCLRALEEHRSALGYKTSNDDYTFSDDDEVPGTERDSDYSDIDGSPSYESHFGDKESEETL